MLKQSYFVDYDQSGRQGHSKKLFKRRSKLDIRKFAFSNRIVDRWNSLSEGCVTCDSINCFKSPILSKLEPETTMKCWYFGEWALYGIKPVPTKPSVRRYWWPSVNSVILWKIQSWWPQNSSALSNVLAVWGHKRMTSSSDCIYSFVVFCSHFVLVAVTLITKLV